LFIFYSQGLRKKKESSEEDRKSSDYEKKYRKSPIGHILMKEKHNFSVDVFHSIR
jgi:hypothetical protein